MTNNEKDTAFHEAVRGNHLDVVKLLIQEGPDFSYSQNDAGETPLYMAVERRFEKLMHLILLRCASLAHDGPLGRTTLHAAVIWNSREMILKILGRIAQQEQSAFIKKVDEKHWTPLHCAAYFDSYCGAKMLLEIDRSIAYMKDAKGVTALHIAAHRGHYCIMECILEYCPDCCELVDEKGWNALHFVVNSSSSYWVNEAKCILKNSSLSNLLNEKDTRGNTPLHHHSKSLHYIKDVMCHDRVDKMTFNKQNLNAYDVALTSEELSDTKFMEITVAISKDERHRAEFRRPLEDDILPERKDSERWNAEWDAHKAEWKARKHRFVYIMEKASETHLVVDTLIATVAFTVGITMPGGFIGQEGPHPGSAILTSNTAFKAFIITNTIAMVQSCFAAFIQLFMPLLFLNKDPGDFSFLLASLIFCLSISAMGAMVLAFVLGTYAVLMHSLGLAIANSVLGLLFFVPVLFVSKGCSHYLLEILRVGSSWILYRLCDFKHFLGDNAQHFLDDNALHFLGDALDCILNVCEYICYYIARIFYRCRQD
ncbi:protein ACCELERATED CELL DEATH 6 [Quercus suber]